MHQLFIDGDTDGSRKRIRPRVSLEGGDPTMLADDFFSGSVQFGGSDAGTHQLAHRSQGFGIDPTRLAHNSEFLRAFQYDVPFPTHCSPYFLTARAANRSMVTSSIDLVPSISMSKPRCR